jgi:predicted amidohydrolase
MSFRVVLAQTNPRLGDLRANLADHLRCISDAVAEGAELIVFPELSLTGYFLKDQVFELGLELDSPILAQLVERSRQISIAVGFVERTRSGRLYNAFAFLEKGAILGLHRKVHLVSYGLFDEARDFAAGDRFEIVESRLGRFGALICEDLWHVPGSYLHYLNDADALIVPSASPARGVEAAGQGLGSQRTWDTLLRAFAILYRSWVLYAARVGWEDGIGFGGGTRVIDPFGVRLAGIEGLDAATLGCTIDRAALHRARMETPLRRDEKPWILATGLVAHVPLLEGWPAQEAPRE